MTNSILEIKKLSVSFPNLVAAGEPWVHAVREAGLSVREGSFTSLVGQSGSGKSVMALTVCRLIKHSRVSGEIFYKKEGRGLNLLALSERELLNSRGSQIAYIFQDPASSLNPVMRVGEQVSEAHRTHFPSTAQESKSRTLALLASVQLGDAERVYKSYPHELSGGMKQRAMIAMALIAEPKLLIADEPTTALDWLTESEILKLLIRLQKERSLSILFITHNITLAASFSETIYAMHSGSVVERLERGVDGFQPREHYTERLFKADLSLLRPKSFIEV